MSSWKRNLLIVVVLIFLILGLIYFSNHSKTGLEIHNVKGEYMDSHPGGQPPPGGKL